MKNINLPTPDSGTPRIIQRLISRLYDLFGRIRPASGWRDLLSSITQAKVGVPAPTWAAFRNGVYAYRFSASQDNEVQIALHLPHDMAFSYRDEEGNLTTAKLFPHIHWSQDGTASGNVVFEIEYTYAMGYGDGTFPAATTMTMTATAPGVQYTHEITETSDANALISTDFEPDGVILMRVARLGTDAGDTLTDPIFIHFADLHYFSDGLQTNERNRDATAVVPWTKQATL